MTQMEILDAHRQRVRDLRNRIPAVFEGYAAMKTAASVEGGTGVAILMDGGPGTVHGPRAFAAFQEFAPT